MSKLTLSQTSVSGIGSFFSVPVIVENFSQISAVSLEVVFNSSCMRLESISSVSPKLEYNQYVPGKVRILWSGTPKSIPDGHELFHLNFNSTLESITGIEFTQELCELASWDGVVIETQFIGCEVSITE